MAKYFLYFILILLISEHKTQIVVSNIRSNNIISDVTGHSVVSIVNNGGHTEEHISVNSRPSRQNFSFVSKGEAANQDLSTTIIGGSTVVRKGSNVVVLQNQAAKGGAIPGSTHNPGISVFQAGTSTQGNGTSGFVADKLQNGTIVINGARGGIFISNLQNSGGSSIISLITGNGHYTRPSQKPVQGAAISNIGDNYSTSPVNVQPVNVKSLPAKQNNTKNHVIYTQNIYGNQGHYKYSTPNPVLQKVNDNNYDNYKIYFPNN